MNGVTPLRGSVLMIVSPVGTDAAFRLDESRDDGARAAYVECSIESALSRLRSHGPVLITTSSRCLPFPNWQVVFEELEKAAARPAVIIAVAAAGQELWRTAFDSAQRNVYVMPVDLDDMVRLLSTNSG